MRCVKEQRVLIQRVVLFTEGTLQKCTVKEKTGGMMQQNNPKQRKKPTRREKITGGAQVVQRERNKIWSEQYGISKIQLTEKQKVLRNKIIENDLTFVVGSSGSGKTLTVLYTYIQEYLQDQSKQIVIVRTPVEAGLDKVGALPNSLQEKIEPHFNSSKILLCDLLSKGKVETDLDHRIHFKIPNYMLGSTLDNSLILIDECFDESHEFLSTSGWKNVKDINENDEILQFNENYTSEFVKPTRVIHKEYSGDIYKFNNDSLSFAVTENHRLVFEDTEKKLRVKLAKDTSDDAWFAFTSSFGNTETPECSVTDDEIKMSVIHTVLSTSIAEIRGVLQDSLRSKLWSSEPKLLCGTSEKNFNLDAVLKLSQRQLLVFLKECQYWSESTTKGEGFVYSSSNEHNADVVQIVGCMTGFTTYKSTEAVGAEKQRDKYKVLLRDTNIRVKAKGFNESKTSEKYNGDVHCVQVPSGMLLTRRNGKVHVSGNCQQLSPLILKLVLERTGINSKVCVLGDNSQLYVDAKGRNALRDAIPRFFKDDGTPKFNSVCYHEFDVQDVLRSELTKSIIKAYT